MLISYCSCSVDIQAVKVIVERGPDLGAVYAVQLVCRFIIDDIGHDDQTHIHVTIALTDAECQAGKALSFSTYCFLVPSSDGSSSPSSCRPCGASASSAIAFLHVVVVRWPLKVAAVSGDAADALLQQQEDAGIEVEDVSPAASVSAMHCVGVYLKLRYDG